MSVFMIGYDLHPKRGKTYDDFLNAIPKVGTSSWHCIDSIWLVKSDWTAVQIRDVLKKHINGDDQLLVAKYESSKSAWFGFTGDCQVWLKDNM
jgi:hypothetical protein